MNNHELFNRAKWWLSQGVELVPIRTDSKAVVKGYGAHSKHVTTEAEAWLWWQKHQVNLGVVCGGLIGLTCVDFDETSAFDTWRAGPGQGIHTLIEQTGRGYHVFVITEQLPNVLTAQVELKASGVVMTAPSVHPSGKRYQVIANDPIAHLTAEQVGTFFPFVSAILSQPIPEVEPGISTPPAVEKSGTDVVSRIKAARPVSQEARLLTDLRGQGSRLYGRCPFHEDRQPSFWVDDEAGIWGCYSPHCPTNTVGHAHDIINLREWAKGISTHEAIRELATEYLPAMSQTRQSAQNTQNTQNTHEGRNRLSGGSNVSSEDER